MRPRLFLRIALAALLVAAPALLPAAPAKKTAKPAVKAATPVFSNAYESPRSKTRPKRSKTQFIILHTTEGALKGSLEKLRKNGECHYVVDQAGVIYRIVDRRRIAFHCGLSMWNGVTDINRFSIGIEIVGAHDKELTAAQYASLKYLLTDLKRIYKVPDEKILTHSMVAYGTPNRWQKKNHRGRKRCGMLLADPARRARMGVYSRPAYDPDLRAGRLFDADPYLTRMLYGKGKSTATATAPATTTPARSSSAPSSPRPAATTTPATPPGGVIGPKCCAWDIAKERYNAPTTLYRFPDGTVKKGSEIKNWKSVPTGTVVTLPSKTTPPPSSSPPSSTAPSTPSPSPSSSSSSPSSSSPPSPTPSTPPSATLPDPSNVIGPKRNAWDIARDLYNAPTTRYRFPNGTEKKGSDIRDWKAIPAGTVVLVENTDDNAVDGATIVGRDANSIRDLVGDEARASSTFYVEPGAKTFRRGSAMTQEQIDALPGGTRVLVCYSVGGPVAAKKRAFDICGVNWNRPETYYLTPRGEFIAGDAIDEKGIPMGAWVFFRE